MAKKLWQKDQAPDQEVDRFTVGQDRELDLYLAPFDVLGSLAHATMLTEVGLLEPSELPKLRQALSQLYEEIEAGRFEIQEGVEDVHSQVELLLTERLGDLGKKIHSGRSRNDQVLLDLKLYMRNEIQSLAEGMGEVFHLLLEKAAAFKDVLIPGYTHFQAAMPSSIGLWLSAYAEGLADDLVPFYSTYKIVNRNPLGSAAGYGSNFPLDREMTTRLLGFEGLNVSSVYAQMGRGKAERVFATALANVAATLNKLAADCCLYMSQDLGFIGFPDELTTGSSIMPHKKNPDVWEIIRGRCNQLQALPNQITLITTNMPSGYHRETQLTKETLIPAIATLKDCLKMTALMMEHLEAKPKVLEQEKYRYVFSVEAVNEKVKAGTPFRDAYVEVGRSIEAENFQAPKGATYTHLGSIGNLGLGHIRKQWESNYALFPFEETQEALSELLL